MCVCVWGGGGVEWIVQSYSNIRGYSYTGVGGRVVIRGLFRDVRVTLTSGDTLTQQWGVEWLSVICLWMSE